MTISDKTRKLLWSRSGNHCPLCGRALTQVAQGGDSAAIIGDECHIVSGSEGGPRFDPHFSGDIDAYENLLLLCASDHRVVDTQVGAYSVEKLKQLKANHEQVVAAAIDGHLTRAAGPDSPPDLGRDNYRTEIAFAPGQAVEVLERFQRLLMYDSRVRAYGKVGTGFSGPSTARRLAWVQSFLPVSEKLATTLALEASVRIKGVRHERLPGLYQGPVPD